MQRLVVFRDRLKTLNTTPVKFNIRILPWLSNTTETTSETVDMGWEAEWDGLGDNEPWATETHLAGSTQKAIQDFRKWWNRYHL